MDQSLQSDQRVTPVDYIFIPTWDKNYHVSPMLASKKGVVQQLTQGAYVWPCAQIRMEGNTE